LNLSYCEGINEDGVIEVIKYCGNLVQLELANTKNAITSVAGFNSLSKLKNLETLNLAQASVGDSLGAESYKIICDLKNLKSLNLSG
jgi:hypothetical protein